MKQGSTFFQNNRITAGGRFALAALVLTGTLTIPGTIPAAMTAESSAEELILEGELRYKNGDLNQAAGLIEEALTKADAENGVKTMRVGWTELGFIRVDQGRFAEAERLLRKALGTCAKGSRDRIVASGNLALVLIEEAKISEADLLTSSALEQSRQILGPTSEEYAKLLAVRAKIAMSQGQLPTAISLLRQAAEIVTAGPPDREELGNVYQNLAAAAALAGKTGLALSSLGRAREAWLSSLPEDHPAQLFAENTLICIYMKARQYQKAYAATKALLPRAERSLGPDDPRLAAILNNVGMVFEHEKREGDAADAFYRAYRIDLRSLGPYHPNTAYALLGYRKAMAKGGQPAEGASPQRQGMGYRGTMQ